MKKYKIFEKRKRISSHVIIQDETTLQVLMLGFMNEEALKLTEETGEKFLFSRTKDRIWLKGESSENYLYVKSIEKKTVMMILY